MKLIFKNIINSVIFICSLVPWLNIVFLFAMIVHFKINYDELPLENYKLVYSDTMLYTYKNIFETSLCVTFIFIPLFLLVEAIKYRYNIKIISTKKYFIGLTIDIFCILIYCMLYKHDAFSNWYID